METFIIWISITGIIVICGVGSAKSRSIYTIPPEFLKDIILDITSATICKKNPQIDVISSETVREYHETFKYPYTRHLNLLATSQIQGCSKHGGGGYYSPIFFLIGDIYKFCLWEGGYFPKF